VANTTWNPADKTATGSLSGGNLVYTSGTGSGVRTTDHLSSGKYYWEYTATSWTATATFIGTGNASANLSTITSTPNNGAGVLKNGNIWSNNANSGLTFGTRATGDILGVAVDTGSLLIWFRLAPSGNWNATAGATPGGTGGISISLVGSSLFGLVASNVSGDTFTANFGDSAFTGAVPSGFTSGFPTGASASSGGPMVAGIYSDGL